MQHDPRDQAAPTPRPLLSPCAESEEAGAPTPNAAAAPPPPPAAPAPPPAPVLVTAAGGSREDTLTIPNVVNKDKNHEIHFSLDPAREQ